MIKKRIVMLTLGLAALAAFMLTAAPVPVANASGGYSYGDDPCYYTRHHAGDDFDLWEQFCEDTVRELAHREAATAAFCGRASYETIRRIRRICRRHCDDCRNPRDARPCRIPKRAKNVARKGKLDIGKCVWDARMDYDAIYDNARAQLEATGYDCLVQKLYVAYQGVSTRVVRNQREANMYIDKALYRCRCEGGGGGS